MKKVIITSLFAIAILFSFAFIPASDLVIENEVNLIDSSCEETAAVACVGSAKGISTCSNPSDNGYYFFRSVNYISPIYVADGSANFGITLPAGNYTVYFVANKCKMSAKWSFCSGGVTGSVLNALIYPGPPVAVATFVIP